MLSIDEKNTLASRHYRYFDRFVKIGLASLTRKNIPVLTFGEDNGAYTNKHVIHIGLSMPLFEYVDDEEGFIGMMLYLLGHEMQHCLSTPDKYWKWGVAHGQRIVCEKISEKYEGKGVRKFRRESDYEHFIEAMRKDHNLAISLNQIQHFCHYIQNSVCDGRIERIRCEYHPGFKNYMIVGRGKYWDNAPAEFVGDIDSADAMTRLSTELAQILFISTTSLYQKEYLKHYADTRVTERIDSEFTPIIRKGVMSKSCKGAMQAAIELETLLVEDIIDAVTMDADALEKILSAIESAIAMNGDGSGQQMDPFGLTSDEQQSKEDDESDDESSGASGEESEDDAEGSSGQGSGEGSDDESEGSSGNGSGEDSDEGEETEDAGGNSKGDSKDKSDGKSNDKSKNSSDGSGDESSDENNSGADSTGDGNGKLHDDHGNSVEGGKYGLSLDARLGANNVGSHSDGSVTTDELEREIDEAIKSAMEAASEAMQGDIATIQSSVPVMPKWPEVNDVSPAPRALDMPEKYSSNMRFKEYKRKYKVSMPMPVELQSRADAFARKIDRLFQDQVKPVIRGHQSGGLDASSLYKLAIRQTDFYIKRGQVPEFDGCAYFLGDNSGSMGYGLGSKRQYCTEAFAIAEEGFKNRMPLKITFFDAQNDDFVTHEVVKGFDEKLHNSCSYNFFLSGRNGAGNKDGYSIRIATQELLERGEKNKILIIASDGCPTEYCSFDDGMADVKDAVETARRAGIKVVCIFFSHSLDDEDIQRVADMYQYDYICTTPDQIEDELAKTLQTFVFN